MPRLPYSPVTLDEGEVPSLFDNAGTANPRADRRLEGSVPWDGGASANAGVRAKLTHFRAPGLGDAMWSGACVYDLAGQSPSVSEYDRFDCYADDAGLGESIENGVLTRSGRLEVGEPTITRESRVAAHFDSAPAAATFQGYFNPRWSGLLAGFRPIIAPRPLHSNFNPNQQGAKELHKATQYKPVPPMGSIVGYFGGDADKAI